MIFDKQASRSNEVLRATIEEQAQRIRDLEEGNTLKAKWLNMLVHDIRGVLGNTIWLLDNYLMHEIDEDAFNQLLPILKANAALQLEGFNKTAAWARVQLDTLKAHLEPVDPAAVLDAVMQQFDVFIKQKELTVNVSIHSEKRPLGDAVLMQFVLKQVVDNAIKFSDVRGVIDIDVSEGGPGLVYVEVVDHGIGMDANTLANIYRPDKTKYLGTAGETGAGLALLICKDYVEMQQGTLHIQSELGTGTKVVIAYKQAIWP